MSDVETPGVPNLNFTVHPAASSFTVRSSIYISNHPGERFNYSAIATGALVFAGSSPERILLIQRAAHDSGPNKWEIPGGGCDEEDPSVLHGVARELWEEAGLRATSIGPQVGEGQYFFTRSGKLVCKFSFLVEVEKAGDVTGKPNVKLDPKEHQSYVWATEEEIRAKKVGDMVLRFTSMEQVAIVLEGFKLRSTLTAGGVQGLSEKE